MVFLIFIPRSYNSTNSYISLDLWRVVRHKILDLIVLNQEKRIQGLAGSGIVLDVGMHIVIMRFRRRFVKRLQQYLTSDPDNP